MDRRTKVWINATHWELIHGPNHSIKYQQSQYEDSFDSLEDTSSSESSSESPDKDADSEGCFDSRDTASHGQAPEAYMYEKLDHSYP